MERKKIESGVQIGKLTVLSPTEERKNGYRIWLCGCACGNTISLDTRTLQRGTVRDCGCETKVKAGQRDVSGQRFGRLVALEPTAQRNKSGSTIWRCRCDCGKEVLTPITQLTGGYTKSCGCLGHPPLKDYVGKRFGHLVVTSYAGKDKGMHRWNCVCDCGKETVVGQTLLQSGKTKSCGCNGNPPLEDLTGAVFGRLTVLGKAESQKGSGYWRCRCECGKETVVRYGNLISGHTKSCGCLQAGIAKETLKWIDGTSVTLLEARRARPISSNTSGYNGVYFSQSAQKWVAQITFKGKTYYLGSYLRVEEAAQARKSAEERLYGEFLDWYYEMHS